MKDKRKMRIASMVGIIAIIAVIGLSVSSCSKGAGKKKFVWTAVTNEQSGLAKETQFAKIVYGNGNFVAIKYNEYGTMAHSTDGISWTELSQQQTTFNYKINGLAWGNDKFVAIGNENMAYSSDGLTWTQITFRFGRYNNGFFNSIAWGNDKFVATLTDGRMAYSSDGIA